MIRLNTAGISSLVQQLQPHIVIKQLPVYGFMKNILRGVIPYCVYADKWPHYTTLVAKPCPHSQQTLPVDRLAIYSENVSRLEAMLCHRHFLTSDRGIILTGLAVDCIPAVECASEVLGLNLSVMGKEDHRHVFCMPPDSQLNESALPEDVYFTRLEAHRHMDAVVSSWKTFNWYEYFDTDTEGIEVTHYHLTHFPSSGIFRKSDHALLSWVCSDVDTCGWMGISRPECRRTNISACRQAEFARQKFALGDYFWGLVGASNVKQKNLVMKAGSGMMVHTDQGFVNCILKPRTV